MYSTVVPVGAVVGGFGVQDKVHTVSDPVIEGELLVVFIEGCPCGVVCVLKEGAGCFETEAVEEISGFHSLYVVLAQTMTSDAVSGIR